ncbi:MAG: aminotransferase class V-fold PLP-dependent enzyme, partial [Candidatus Dojkabacteria bacterium]
PNVVVSKNAHFSFYRCAKILGVEVKTVGVDDQYKMDLSLTEEAIDKNTVLLVGILGSTELGIIDDVVELDKIAFKHSLDLHLDAAIGGFILPFLNDVDSGVYRFDKLKSLNSINISGHKFGLSLPGCGLLLLRTRKEVDKFSDTLDYLSSGEGRMEGLLVSRSSAGSFSLALNILNYGNNGYTEFARGYAQTMKKLIEYFKSTPFKVIVGDSATPQIFIHGSNIEDLSANLFEKGWIQAPYKPKVFTDKGIRIVIKKDQEELLQTAFISEVESYLNKKTKPSNHLLHESKLSL